MMPLLINFPLSSPGLRVKTNWWRNEIDSKMWPPTKRESDGGEEYLAQIVPFPNYSTKKDLREEFDTIVNDTDVSHIDLSPNGPDWEWIAMTGRGDYQTEGATEHRFSDIWDAIDGIYVNPNNFWSDDELHDFYETWSVRNQNYALLTRACLLQFIEDDFGPMSIQSIGTTYERTEDLDTYVWRFVEVRETDATAYDVFVAISQLENSTGPVTMHWDKLRKAADIEDLGM